MIQHLLVILSVFFLTLLTACHLTDQTHSHPEVFRGLIVLIPLVLGGLWLGHKRKH